jgi:hypothetical protein
MAVGLLEIAAKKRAGHARVLRAAGRGHAVGDGCSLAAVGCERSSGLCSSSGVRGNGVQDGCLDAEDGCDDAGDGCSFAAVVLKSPNAVRVEAGACRRLVHHGRLFASGRGELSATGCHFAHDGCFDAHVGRALTGRAREDAADVRGESAVDRIDSALARE